jgi:hypothetical protein
MRKISFRVWLPFVIGVVSVVLMAWSLHIPGSDCDVIDEMRINWHCGGSGFILELMSAPAIKVADSLADTWSKGPREFTYIVELPFIILLWWFMGTRVDFGLLGTERCKHRGVWLGALLTSFAILLAFFGWSLWKGVQFYRAYSDPSTNTYLASIKDLRSLPLRLWLMTLMLTFGLAALRIARGRTTRSDKKLVSLRTVRLFGFGLTLYCACGAGELWRSKLAQQRWLAEYELRHIIIRGRVLDERGLPAHGVKVDLVPVLADGKILEGKLVVYDGGSDDITDSNGDYILRPWEAGRYLLVVQREMPPSTSAPFLTRYYPDSPDPRQAEILDITPARHMTVNSIRLQRLELGKVPVSVFWSDGTPEPDVYYSFMNTSYPKFGPIEGMGPASPDGTVSLPIGFEYLGTVKTDCPSGESSRSVFTTGWTFSLKSTNTITKPLRIVLPGNPCRKLHSK